MTRGPLLERRALADDGYEANSGISPSADRGNVAGVVMFVRNSLESFGVVLETDVERIRAEEAAKK